MLRLFVFSLLFSALFNLSFSAVKLACVDTTTLLKDSKRVKEAQDKLRAKVIEFQKELEAKRRRLEELKKQIESKAISQQAKEEKIKEYQRIEAEGFELQQKAQREIASLKEQLENQVLEEVKKVVEQVAVQKGYDGVIDCAVFLYRDNKIGDITSEVLNALDSMK